MHGENFQFSYDYLLGTNFVSTLTCEPWDFKRQTTFEALRDLPIGITYTDSESNSLVIRTQINDPLGRPTTRSQQRINTTPTQYSYQYNTCGELTYAAANTDEYRYQYDNIGNRNDTLEQLLQTDYLTNPLNQYTDIRTEQDLSFLPTYDSDGNQTLIKTETGIWQVDYNAENRPIRFYQQQGDLIDEIKCSYDYLGRRYYKSHYSFGGLVGETTEEHFLYRGYLLIYRKGDYTDPTLYIWDPTEPVATRPLYLVGPGGMMMYGHDFNKNVTEIFYPEVSGEQILMATCDYTPYGSINYAEGDLGMGPFYFSSEYFDSELGLVYYNYRHYNPANGRWINRDLIEEQEDINLYLYAKNNPIYYTDYLGLSPSKSEEEPCFQELSITLQFSSAYKKFHKDPEPTSYLGSGTMKIMASCTESSKVALATQIGDVEYDKGFQPIGTSIEINLFLTKAPGSRPGGGSYVIKYLASYTETYTTTTASAVVGGVIGKITAGIYSVAVGAKVGTATGTASGLAMKGITHTLQGVVPLSVICFRGELIPTFLLPSKTYDESVMISGIWVWPEDKKFETVKH